MEIQYEKSGSFETLATKDMNGNVAKNPDLVILPSSLKSRITIEGNATLVLSAVNKRDSTRYRCVFVAKSGAVTQADAVQLILAGEWGTGMVLRIRGCFVVFAETGILAYTLEHFDWPMDEGHRPISSSFFVPLSKHCFIYGCDYKKSVTVNMIVAY